MGHSKLDKLQDLSCELTFVRKLLGIVEKKPGVFYIKSVPFLHFHDKENSRWADVKTTSGNWQRIDIPFSAGSVAKRNFVKVIESQHQLWLEKSKNLRKE